MVRFECDDLVDEMTDGMPWRKGEAAAMNKHRNEFLWLVL